MRTGKRMTSLAWKAPRQSGPPPRQPAHCQILSFWSVGTMMVHSLFQRRFAQHRIRKAREEVGTQPLSPPNQDTGRRVPALVERFHIIGTSRVLATGGRLRCYDEALCCWHRAYFVSPT